MTVHTSSLQSKLRRVSAAELIAELESQMAAGDLLAFDADGTLWSGDIGEDAYHLAVEERLLRADALPELRAWAARFGVLTQGDANEVTARVFSAYMEGRFPEREVCELLAWCYAGFTRGELAEFARRVPSVYGLQSRLHRGLAQIIDWARRRQLRTVVVSASPHALVTCGAALLGFAEQDVIAARPAFDGDRLAARMEVPVPYGPSKYEYVQRQLGESRWIASFGDNVFDLDMLRAAKFGVVVNPKPALQGRLPDHPELLLLDASAP